MTDLDSFVGGYVTCMLWAETDESSSAGGVPLDKNYNAADISPETMKKIRDDCAKFLKMAGELINEDNFVGYMEENNLFGYAGHDFWLTRNHHGSGFWDGDWEEAVGKQLTRIAHYFPEVSVYVGSYDMIFGG